MIETLTSIARFVTDSHEHASVSFVFSCFVCNHTASQVFLLLVYKLTIFNESFTVVADLSLVVGDIK